MSGWAPRRFWAEALAEPAEGGWTVRLDARPLHTPAKAPLLLPTEALARMVAAEWQAQGERVDPGAMPATRMANSAIDKVAAQQDGVAAVVADYGGTDLLCYRAAWPEELARQQRVWDAPLDWAARRYGARLRLAEGLMPVAQPPEALARLHAAVAALPPFELAPLHDLVALAGSLVLGLAVAEGALEAEAAWDLSRIDEAFEAGQWGRDDEAEAAAAARRAAFLFARDFLRAARN